MSVKSSTELMLYVVLTMPTLNKAYLFIYLFITCVLKYSLKTVIRYVRSKSKDLKDKILCKSLDEQVNRKS